jgi:TonB family protein
VRLLVHVDRSGWVCGAVVAVSSGTTALDASALDTVGRWRLGPAKKASTPVEALHPLAVTFQIQP